MSDLKTLGIAEIKTVQHPETMRTVLGSCVGVALYDRAVKKGGMAHIMLPSSDTCHGDRGKFADTAVDDLLNQVIRIGCDKTRLAAKICGGASMFGPKTDNGLGERNISAVKAQLKQHSIRLVAEDVGGQKGRRMTLNPQTGEVEVQIIGATPSVI